MPAQSKYTMTFQRVHDNLDSLAELLPAERTQLRSAVKRFCEVCNLVPSTAPADGPTFRAAAAGASWQLAGLTKASWANIKSRVTAAMQRVGVNLHRRRQFKLSPEWEALIDACAADERLGLRRFGGWCTVQGIAPNQVIVETFTQFLLYLTSYSTVTDPRERWQTARRAWNRYVAKTDSVYPVIPNNEPDGWRGLPLAAFAASLGAEVAKWRAHMLRTDPFAATKSNDLLSSSRLHKPLKQVTADGYIASLRQSASRLVEAGWPISKFASLEAFVDSETAEAGLRQVVGERDFDEARPGMHALMTATLSLAAYLEIGGETLEELKRLAKVVRHRPKGMCERNKSRLQPFKDAKALELLMRLPVEVARRFEDVKSPKIEQAQLMQMAVLLELLLHVPMRVKNAASLDIDKHFQRPVAGNSGHWRLNIKKGEVKSDRAIDADLSEATSALFDRYVSVFRPPLNLNQSSALFISMTGKQKGGPALSRQFSKFIRRELGLTVNIHLMRHLMGFAYLQANPGDYEGVRQLLGHKQITTTVNFYSGAEAAASFRRLDEVVSRARRWGSNNDFTASKLIKEDVL